METGSLIILVACALACAIASWFIKRYGTPTQLYDQQKAQRVAEIMTEILTVLYTELGIRKPYDVYSVWSKPTYNGSEWLYHAKARQSDNVQLDDDSLLEYRVLINGRASDISAPLTVTDIHPRGKTFVYDIAVTDNVVYYQTPSEMSKNDRDF
ncbi:MAG: hypothetical protein FWD90_13975 [Defluviitaleaceae bacterium]|nr:hypothetical protein [Defluviitaleaceae bacterium]